MAAGDRPVDVIDHGWSEMSDSLKTTARVPGKYQLAVNCYPEDGSLVSRPALRKSGAMGAGHFTRTQAVVQWTRKDGTEFTIGVLSGEIYLRTWTGQWTGTWTKRITTAQLTAAAITCSASQPIQIFPVLAGAQVLINDGVNVPFAWDGTIGGGLTKLTNAPAFAPGSATLYNGRIMGVKASDRSTFVWSETDVLNTGYEAGGFNNAWTFTQSDSNPLVKLVGLNESILVIRARSTTEISGVVTQNWSTGGTRDTISPTIGTLSPFSVVILPSGSLFLLDADMRPQLIQPGGDTIPLWHGLREAIRVRDTTNDPVWFSAVHWTPGGLLLCQVATNHMNPGLIAFAVPEGGGIPTPVCLFSILAAGVGTNPTWLGLGPMAMCKTATTSPPAGPDFRYLLLATEYSIISSGDGGVYVLLNPEDVQLGGQQFNDALEGVNTAISHVVVTQALGFSPSDEKIWDRVDIVGGADSAMTLDVTAITGHNPTAFGIYTLTPQRVVMNDPPESPGIPLIEDGHATVGLDVAGRWVQIGIAHATLDEGFILEAIEVHGASTNNDPEAP